MNAQRTKAALLLLLAILGCGSAELVTPEPLRIVDTYPSNGAVVTGPDVPVAVVFSVEVVEATLETALMLEEISDSGAPIRIVPTALSEYSAESRTASYTTPDLDPDTAYQLRILQSELQSTEGTTLLADFVRRFKTAP